jgi:hypothetical protein
MMTNPNEAIVLTEANYRDDDSHKGLTKREYFAVLIAQGMLASGQMVTGDRDADSVEAVRRADALIATLSFYKTS